MRAVKILLVVLVLAGWSEAASAADRIDMDPARARFAPSVTPELLFATAVGGEGDQWFNMVGFKGSKIAAGNKDRLVCLVQINDDGTLEAKVKGDLRKSSKDFKRQLPNGGTVGPYSFGYNQVHKILQQPWLKVGGKQLWGWSEQQAKSSSVKYSPFMSDSRIRTLFLAPDGHGVAVGSADGGNTCLRAHPADINQPMAMGLGYGTTGGGGGGLSSWVFDISPKAEVGPVAMVFRGQVCSAAWDRWGRMLLGGQALTKTGSASVFGYDDGAGVMLVNRDWSDAVFAAHIGKGGESSASGMIWALAINNELGLAAAAGWMDGDFVGPGSLQPRSGGGKDAFMAVWRLWTPADYQVAIEAEAAAQVAE
ncbi:MAG: hypothetical protein PF961_06955 [Planctomycetota bacterium]|jgi:acylphosphatase|nr:hypothetical protein [Planctomycetota bacterium]